MSKTVFNTIVFIVACITLYFIAQQLIADNKVPSFGEFIASSTQLTTGTSTVPITAPSVFNLPTKTLYTATSSIKIFIADTDISREQGLSGVKTLLSGNGVLFVFDTPGKYGFWMKDMYFPIDMIWIDSNKKIVGVTKNVLPSSYPFVFMPPQAIVYVLEMNAGSVAEFGLTTGTTVRF